MDRIDHGAQAAAEHGIARSPLWHHFEQLFVAKHPDCLAGNRVLCPVKPQVHHRIPFHIVHLLGRPELELDERNVVPLCESEGNGKDCSDHHRLIGHLDFFQSSNYDVVVDAVHRFKNRTAAQIKADPVWQAKVAHRPKPWAQMTDTDKRDLRALMDHLFPPLAKAA